MKLMDQGVKGVMMDTIREGRHIEEWPSVPYISNRWWGEGSPDTITRISFAYTRTGRPHRRNGTPVFTYARVVVPKDQSLAKADETAIGLLRKTAPKLPAGYYWGDVYLY